MKFSSLGLVYKPSCSAPKSRSHIYYLVHYGTPREHFRAMILYDQRSGLTQQHSFERLCAAFLDQAPSRTTVFEKFRHDWQSLKDEPRSGRPRSATTEEHVAAVKVMVEEDARVTVVQLAHDLGISSGSFITTLHEKLRYNKACARWVPPDVEALQCW